MTLRTITLEIVVDVGSRGGDLAGSSLITSLLTNNSFIQKIATISETEGELEAVEGKVWLEVNKEAGNG